MRKILFEIENCLDCPNHFNHNIPSVNPLEHIIGCFCSKKQEEDWIKQQFFEQKNKCVAYDNWSLREKTEIPYWCPLLNTKEETNDVRSI